jgi:peptidyl-prolyl cis-trans isomerase C
MLVPTELPSASARAVSFQTLTRNLRIRPSRSVRLWGLGCALAAASTLGCDGCGGDDRGAALADAGTAGRLTPAEASQVLARVGERTITLGDYAAALERMDPFERMRYQTEDRRQALLDEMINVELLAREAERRGLDRRPETVELVRQFQRDEALARLRATLPRPADLPAAEVSAYYQEHRAEFQEGEMRRAAQIVVGDPAVARRLVHDAAGASPERWRELVQANSPEPAPPADKAEARPAIDVPGDLGFLSRIPEGGTAPEVPAPVRDAVFRIEHAGDVFPEPVVVAGRQHVLRLLSIREPRQRSLAEVDASIRMRLIEARQADARKALLERLRRAITVQVDEAALERVAPPNAPAPQAPR